MNNRTAIREVIENWASHTLAERKDRILENHQSDALFFDVLAPDQYKGVKAYRDSWDEWQPELGESFHFGLDQLQVTAGQEVGFAHGFIRCGGTTKSGHVFDDVVRATFCLVKADDRWCISHQHISKPVPR